MVHPIRKIWLTIPMWMSTWDIPSV